MHSQLKFKNFVAFLFNNQRLQINFIAITKSDSWLKKFILHCSTDDFVFT